MQDHCTYFMPHERRRRVEAAILALTLAEDWPWRVGELAQRLRLPADLIQLGATTLRTDGLLVARHDKLRASWAAVRGDELANWSGSNKRRVYVPDYGAAIPLH